MFCDLRCVRDAVVRGDLNIRRNLKKATDITNKNIKAFAEWGVDSMHSQTNWLAEKIDHLGTSLGIIQKGLEGKLDDILGKVDQESFVQAAGAKMASMVQEIQGFTQAAALDSISRDTARSALEQFVHSAEVSGGGANVSHMATALRQVFSLHATLKSAAERRSKTSSVSSMMQQAVKHMQRTMKEQLATIGVYRRHSAKSQEKARAWSSLHARSAEVLVELDKVWWRLRSGLDDHLEQAEKQVAAFRTAFDTLSDYRQCAAGFSELRATYDNALRIRGASHEKLRRTWHDSNHLMGELASIIVDSEAFGMFCAEEGCDSPLATQTLEQASSAEIGMNLLLHRFDAGGLPRPDLEAFTESATRIQKSFEQAKTACGQPSQATGDH